MTTEKIKVPEVEKLLAPGAIYQRVLKKLRNELEEVHVDGSSDYQRGFSEGYRAAISLVRSDEGNLACEVTALRHRKMREGGESA